MTQIGITREPTRHPAKVVVPDIRSVDLVALRPQPAPQIIAILIG